MTKKPWQVVMLMGDKDYICVEVYYRDTADALGRFLMKHPDVIGVGLYKDAGDKLTRTWGKFDESML